jgi:hypothetical protein
MGNDDQLFSYHSCFWLSSAETNSTETISFPTLSLTTHHLGDDSATPRLCAVSQLFLVLRSYGSRRPPPRNIDILLDIFLTPRTSFAHITTVDMSLNDLPSEILAVIAIYIAQNESDGNNAKLDSAAGICYFEDDKDEHHSTTKAAQSDLLLARSPSFWSFASVSRQIRDALFDSRDSRFIKVKYDGKDCQKVNCIPTSLLAKVR